MAGLPYIKEALKSLFGSTVTNRYPYAGADVPKGYRGKIKFHEDLCVGCGMCIKVCSPGAITKLVKNKEDAQEITMRFDLGSCTFCGMCSDFCGKKAIELTRDYAMVTTDKKELIVEGKFLKKLPPKPPAKQVTESK